MDVYAWLNLLGFSLSIIGLFGLGAVVDPSTWADKMITRVKNAASDWEKGVANPRRSPVAGMKAAAGKWKNNMQKAIAEDRWARSVNQLTDEAIKAAAAKVGGGKFVDGVTARGK